MLRYIYGSVTTWLCGNLYLVWKTPSAFARVLFRDLGSTQARWIDAIPLTACVRLPLAHLTVSPISEVLRYTSVFIPVYLGDRISADLNSISIIRPSIPSLWVAIVLCCLAWYLSDSRSWVRQVPWFPSVLRYSGMQSRRARMGLALVLRSFASLRRLDSPFYTEQRL